MSDKARFMYLLRMSDHDLIGAYAYACAVMGHGPEAWVVLTLSEWLDGAVPELERRGLLKEAERTEKAMWKDHHARRTREQQARSGHARRVGSEPHQVIWEGQRR